MLNFKDRDTLFDHIAFKSSLMSRHQYLTFKYSIELQKDE